MGRVSNKNLLKIKLLQHGFTQKDISKALNVTEAYVSMLISGRRKSEAFIKWVQRNLKDDLNG